MELETRRRRKRTSLPIMKPYCFFAHIAFALDARAHATPQATANLLIEINHTTVNPAVRKNASRFRR